MLRFIYILFFSLFPYLLLAQNDANLTGHVIDSQTGEHLPFVTIFIKGPNIHTSTDASGHYFVKNLPLGKQTVVASFVGYKTLEQNIVIIPNKVHEGNFSLTPDQQTLVSAVVVHNRAEHLRTASPELIKLLPKTLFENTNSNTLSQGLNYQPGLRVETNCQNCGTQQIRINGLDGPYTQIMIDGQALMSALTSVYGVEQIPANMIERVEVVRGGGTAVSGASAIGGSVNIITREPAGNAAILTHTTSLIGGKSADFNTFLNASVISNNNQIGSYIYASVRDRSAYDSDDDGFSEIGNLKATTIGLRSYYKTSDYSRLSLEYHHINEFRRGGDSLDLPPHQTNITEQLEHNIHGAGLRYDLFSSNYSRKLNIHAAAQTARRKSYFGANQSPEGYGKTSDLVTLTGVLFTQAFKNLWFSPAELTAGADYHYNNLEDNVLGYHHKLQQTTHVYSAFAQNEWKGTYFSAMLGVRADKHNLLSNAIFSPRANIRYNLKQGSVFRVSYSEGFRAPQAYNEDLHVSIAGGERVLIVLSPDLKEERSQSYSLSADLFHEIGGVRVNVLVEGFYTHLQNVFRLEHIGSDASGNTLMERRNANSATVKGVNIEARINPIKAIDFQAGVTLQSSQYGQAEKWSDNPTVAAEKRLFRSPNVYGFLLANYQINKHFLLSLSGTYTGSMLLQHLEGYIPIDETVHSPTFWDMGFKVAYNFELSTGIDIQLNAGIQNYLNAYQTDFDKGVNRDSNYIYGPALPRTLNFGCKVSF